jgi:uncharacterized protein DUF5615
MYHPAIAQRLRARGHDAVAVVERADLREAPDEDLLKLATSEGRALLTEDAADLLPIFEAMLSTGERTAGLLISSPRSMPRGKETVGVFVRALHTFMTAHPGDMALRDRVVWLTASWGGPTTRTSRRRRRGSHP